jgi:glycosyltransferase 2 family protein
VKSKLSSSKVHTAAILIATLLLLWLFLRGVDIGEIQKSLLSARPAPLFWALVATMATYFIRAVRWQGLLLPLGRASLVNCFNATVIGFMVNFLAPARLGEIARPYLLARQEGFSASGAFATILLERILDLVTVVFFVAFWLLAGPERSGSEQVLSSLRLGGILGVLLGAILLASMFLFARYPARATAIAHWFFRALPRGLEARAVKFLESFRAGLGVVVHGSGFVRAVLASVVLWLGICLSFWLSARALDVHFGFGDTFLVIGFLTVGVAVPTPGAIGGYHYMCSLALTTLFGVAPSLAAAAALLAHAIAFLPVTFLGILLFVKAGLTVAELK